MDEDAETPKAAKKDATLALFLGLYLILLAFFVLLNTLASLKEDRVKAVLGSLMATFSTEILDTMTPTEFSASVGNLLATEEFHREIREFFEAAVPLSRVESYSAGKLMHARIPADELFEPGSIAFRDDRDELLQRIARSLSRRVEGLRYEVEFSTFTGPFLDDEGGGGLVLEVARAGAFARALFDRGVPGESITIGARPGNPEELEMTFLVRVVDRAKVDFAE
jgi:hypothetical protein